MTDIVKRLRQDFTTDPIPLHAEAADEIERLRERVAELQAHVGYTESIAALHIQKGGKT